MTKKTLLVWVAILTFGFSSLPVVAFSPENKQTGNTEESSKKKPKKKKKSKKHSKKQVKKHKKGSSKYKSGGKKKKYKSVSKKKYSKSKKKGKRYGKKKSKRNRSVYTRKSYTPGTNSNNVEYKNYKRNNDANENNTEIEKIAPQKEIRKEPKKDGE